MAICFYKEFGELGYLASYSNHGFHKEGVYWKTVEHYYQAHKFKDEKIRNLIINAETPKIASTIGRDRSNILRDDWEEVKNIIMYEGVLAKFLAHTDLAKKLLDTGSEKIVEETFLRGDLVKFAKIFPTQEMMKQDFTKIYEFVKRSTADIEAEHLREAQ